MTTEVTGMAELRTVPSDVYQETEVDTNVTGIELMACAELMEGGP